MKTTILNGAASIIDLTVVEQELLLMNAYDYNHEEKALELGQDLGFILKHEQSLLDKMNAESMAAAIRIAFELNILLLSVPSISPR